MTPEQFKTWRKTTMKMTQAEAADALGISRESIINYERGMRREGFEIEIPKPVALACMALRAGIIDYSDPDHG